MISCYWTTPKCVLFNHSLIRVMIPGIMIRMSPAGVGTPLWTASSIGHW